MVANLKRSMRTCCNGWLLLSLLLSPAIAAAQALVDPTRPPDELTGQGKGGGNPLQSIIISPSRRAAIIRGQTVELGEKVGDFRLIEVNETGVVLQGAKGLEVLTLFPSIKIDKKTIAPGARDDKENSARMAVPTGKPDNEIGKKEAK